MQLAINIYKDKIHKKTNNMTKITQNCYIQAKYKVLSLAVDLTAITGGRRLFKIVVL